MAKCILWGGTGQAKVLHEALRREGSTVELIVDRRLIVSPILGINLVCGLSGLDRWLADHLFEQISGLVAIGGNGGKDRLEIMDIFVNKGIHNYRVIHPSAFVALDAVIGEGAQILAQSAICSHARIGRGVIVNTAAVVEHDCEISDGVHIGPRACLAGQVFIDRCSFVGAGAIILPNIHVGANAIVGAGAVVTKNVPAGATVVGNPARCLN